MGKIAPRAANTGNRSSASADVRKGPIGHRATDARAAILVTVLTGPSVSEIMLKPMAIRPAAATNNRIPIHLSPSLPRLRHSLKPARNGPESRLFRVERQRIDKWLWHARVVRTRCDAAALTKSGYVRVNGKRISAASRPVRLGDVVTLVLDHSVRVLRVTAFCVRRGDAGQARTLYRDLTITSGDTASA